MMKRLFVIELFKAIIEEIIGGQIIEKVHINKEQDLKLEFH